MYYPYFRGKQFELLAIRDTANVMAEAGLLNYRACERGSQWP